MYLYSLRHAPDITILQMKADVTFISLQNCVDTDMYIFCNIMAIIQTLRLFTWQGGKQVSWVCNKFLFFAYMLLLCVNIRYYYLSAAYWLNSFGFAGSFGHGGSKNRMLTIILRRSWG